MNILSKRLFFSLLIGLGTALNLNAQSLIVKLYDGSEKTQELSSLQTMKFADSNLLVNTTDGESASYNISSIQKLYFKSTSTDVDVITDNTDDILFYPNPASDVIYIKNCSENSLMSVFNIDGRLIYQTKISTSTSSVNIQNLPQGVYLLKTNNQTFKIIIK